MTDQPTPAELRKQVGLLIADLGFLLAPAKVEGRKQQARETYQKLAVAWWRYCESVADGAEKPPW